MHLWFEAVKKYICVVLPDFVNFHCENVSVLLNFLLIIHIYMII